MATTIPNFAHQYTFSNLDTYNHTVATAGVRIISVSITDASNSAGLTVVIQKNGSQIATASGPSVPLNISVASNCVVSDIITVIVSSTTASDAAPNQIQGTIGQRISAN